MFFIDTSREVYIPFVMNKGCLLYKDILNVYSPLSYQLNSFLFSYIGESLNTLYFSGLINSILFILGIFSIFSLVFDEFKLSGFLFASFLIPSCVFSVSLTNYIFPYAYAMVYALTFFVWSLFCLLFYIKKGNVKILILSFFLFGICLSFKIDFILYSFLLLYILFFKNTNIKEKIICIISFLFVPLLSIIALLIQGVNISDLYNSFKIIIKLSSTNAFYLCYKFIGAIPSKGILIGTVKSFLKTIPFFIVILILFYKISLSKKLNKIFQTIFLILIVCITIILLINAFVVSNADYFSWIGLFAVIQFLFLSFYLLKKSHLSNNDKLIFILFISTLTVSVKTISSVTFNTYGSYYFPLLALCSFSGIIFLFKRISLNKEKSTAIMKSFCLLFTILFFLYAISNYERRSIAFTEKIHSLKGDIYTEKIAAYAIQNTIEYINKNTLNTDKILVLPEGAMLNFLTNRMSDNKYYYLIPPNIELFGEDKVVEDLKTNLPDYIIIQPMSYNNFKETFFCESFGKKVCSLIPKYYEHPIVFGSDFWIAVYKKKDKNENK